MTNKLITVVVPVYNVEQYLAKCVNSIRNQTYHPIELILVDDGSSDGSSTICDNFASEDARIRVVHKTNGGVSSARNAGLELAQGSLVSFIDGDDYVDLDFLQHLYRNLVEYNAEIAACGMIRHEPHMAPRGSGDYRPVALGRTEGIIGCVREISRFANTCNRLYLRTVIRDLQFSTALSYGEDNLFNFHAYSRARRTVIDAAPKYHYIQRSDSATASRDRLTEDRLLMIREMKLAVGEDPDQAIISPHIEAREVMDYVQLLINITRLHDLAAHDTKAREYTRAIALTAKRSIRNPVLPRKFKLATALAALHRNALFAYLRLHAFLEQRR